MDKLRLFAVEAVSRPPVELDRQEEQQQYECKMTVPLPPQLLIFSQGTWPGERGDVTMDIFLDSKHIGTMNEDTKCFNWEVKGLDKADGDQINLEMKVSGLKPTRAGAEKNKAEAGSDKKRSKPKKGKKSNPLTTVRDDENADKDVKQVDDQNKSQSSTPSSVKPKEEAKEKASVKPAAPTQTSEEQAKTPQSSSVLSEKHSNSPTKNITPTSAGQIPKKGRPKRNAADQSTSDKNIQLSDKTKLPSSITEVKKTKQTQLNFGTALKKTSTNAKPTTTDTDADLPKKVAVGKTSAKSSTDKSTSDDSQPANSSPSWAPESTSLDSTDSDRMEFAYWDDSPRGRQTKHKGSKNRNSLFDAQVRNESTPQLPVADMHSPVPKRPAKQKRPLGSVEPENTPDGPTPKKRGIRMREGGTPKTSRVKTSLADTAFTDNTQPSSQDSDGVKHSEGRMTRYTDLSMRNPHPSARWGHSMVLRDPRCAVLIGGQGDRQQLSKDSVWTLHTETRKWESLDVQSEGQKPEYRMGHTATFDPTMRCIYIFGGSKNSRWFHDVHVYDLDENKWTLAKVNGKAPTRAYHTSVIHRHELWVFGGVYPRPDPNPDGCSNEIHIFSPVMQAWYSPLVQGDKPLPRSGHSATLIGDQMVMFGGWDAPFCYNDLFVLDLTTVDWSKPDVKGTPPKPRSWHASGALTNRRILIHGGYDGDNALQDAFIFDLGAMSWSRLVIENTPKARAGHTAICLPYRHENDEEDEVLVFGGGDNDGEFFSDLLSFSIPFNPVVEVE